MVRGSAGRMPPRSGGSSSAASSAGSCGERCHRPLGVHGVGGGVGGDPVGQGEPFAGHVAGVWEPGDGPEPGDAGQPAVGPGLVVDLPDPGVGFGPPGGDRVGGGVAARQWSVSSRSARPAAANSSSDSPNASSWNCWLTQFPIRFLPPGYPGRSRVRWSGTAAPWVV